MTTQTQKTIPFNVSKSTGWKDAFVVSCLAIVLGAFVAQISSTPRRSQRTHPGRLGVVDGRLAGLANADGGPTWGRRGHSGESGVAVSFLARRVRGRGRRH